MTTTVPAGPDTSGVPAAVVDLPDRAQMLRIIAEAVAGGLPAPMTVELFLHSTGTRSLDLRMDNNRAAEVDAWARAVNPTGAPAEFSRLCHTTDRSWRGYSHETSWYGWDFYVWSAVDEPTDAEAGVA